MKVNATCSAHQAPSLSTSNASYATVNAKLVNTCLALLAPLVTVIALTLTSTARIAARHAIMVNSEML